MRLVLTALFHLLPLVPAWLGRVYGTIAALLLVALPYIKSKKLQFDLAHLEAKRTGLVDAPRRQQATQLRKRQCACAGRGVDRVLRFAGRAGERRRISDTRIGPVGARGNSHGQTEV